MYLLQFSDSCRDLLDWMDDNEKYLTDTAIGNDPNKIKQQIQKHKEFQRTLGAKQPAFDSVNRLGRSLKDKAPKHDGPIIQEMLNELKNKWNLLCNGSVDRLVLIFVLYNQIF